MINLNDKNNVLFEQKVFLDYKKLSWHNGSAL